MAFNITIDDSDPTVIYLPPWNAVSASKPCSTCAANPALNLMFNQTYHDGTFEGEGFGNVPLMASILFNGTAMSVFCTLAENSTSPVGNSNMAFYIDGELKGTFVNTFVNCGGYNYNVPVFTIDYLTPQEHNFTLQNGQVNGTKSLVLLDKIVYTAFNSSPTSSHATSHGIATTKSMPSIIIPAVAVTIAVMLLGAAALCFFLKWRRRRARRRWYNRRRITLDPLPPPLMGTWTSEPSYWPSSYPSRLPEKSGHRAGPGTSGIPHRSESVSEAIAPPTAGTSASLPPAYNMNSGPTSRFGDRELVALVHAI